MIMPIDPKRQYYVSDADKTWALQRLQERKMTKVLLARRVGVTRQNIYLLLHGEAKHSHHWPRIVEVLGGTPPSGDPAELDERLRVIMARWGELSEEDKAMVEGLAMRLAAASATNKP